MRLARIATTALLVFLGGCQLIPERGLQQAVYPAPAAAYPDCRADNDPRFAFRKRVLFTRLDIRDRHQLRGLHGIETAYAKALSARLDRDRYHPVSLGSRALQTHGAIDLQGKRLTKASLIANLGREHRAQFVVGGEIIDMAQQQSRGYYSNSFRQLPLLGNYASDPERMIVVRLDIYDASSGLLVDQETFRAWSKDSADLKPLHTLMGERFMHTALGVAMNGVLEQQNEYISTLLSCMPLQTEVERMAGSEHGVLSAGAAQGLRPGDSFKVFRPTRLAGTGKRNISQRPVGRMVLNEVYAEHALGTLESDTGATLRQGDLVRVW